MSKGGKKGGQAKQDSKTGPLPPPAAGKYQDPLVKAMDKVLASEDATPQAMSIKRQVVLRAIKKCRGSVYKACALLGNLVAPSTVYSWMKESKEFNGAVADLRMHIFFQAEDQIVDLIAAGDTTAVIFALKSLGAQFGWGDRQVISGHLSHDVIGVIGQGDGAQVAGVCEAIRLWREQQERINQQYPESVQERNRLAASNPPADVPQPQAQPLKKW